MVCYEGLLPGVEAQISFRENKGRMARHHRDSRPCGTKLDGNDVVLTLDAAMLDRLMTDGLVITGIGATITKVYILKIE